MAQNRSAITRKSAGCGRHQAAGNVERYIHTSFFAAQKNDVLSHIRGGRIAGLVKVPCREKSKCMTEQKLIEHWIRGCAVQRITFHDGLVLNLEDYNELVISTPITLTLPATANSPVEVVSVDP